MRNSSRRDSQWARRTYQIAAYYLPENTAADPPVALMSEPPDADFQKAMAAFDRIIVISPRVGESCNPVPDEFRHIDKTGNVLLMGEIHLFARAPAGRPPKCTAPNWRSASRVCCQYATYS